jgi:hypothetical protein
LFVIIVNVTPSEITPTAICVRGYGLDGKMIDFGKGKEVPVRELIRELLAFVDDVIDDLRLLTR